MLVLIMFIIFLLSGSYFISIYFDTDIELAIPVWVISTTLLAYAFGIFGMLKLGYYMIIIISVLLGILSIVRVVKNKISISSLFTSSLIIFIFLLSVFYFGHYGRLLTRNDEFSHWGLVAKNMFLADGFAGEKESNLLFSDYPPIVATFQYVLLRMNGGYDESLLYTAINILNLSFLIPLFRNISFKKPIDVISRLIIAAYVPIALYTDFYESICVDALLGVVFAYSLFTYSVDNSNNYTLISVSLSLAFLTLIKNAGFGLSLIIVFILLSDKFTANKNIKLSSSVKKRNYIDIVVLFMSSLLSYCSWKIYLAVNNISSTWSISDSSSNKLAVIRIFNPSKLQIIKNFVIYYFVGNSDAAKISLSPFVLLCVALVISIILMILMKKDFQRERFKKLVIKLVVGNYIYLGSILVTYLTVFSEYEALRLASIDRYYNSYMLGFFIIIIFMMFCEFTFNKKRNKIFIIILALLLCILVNPKPLLDITFNTEESIEDTHLLRANYYQYSYSVDSLSENDVVDIIHIESRSFERCIYNYLSTPKMINGNLSIGTEPYYDGDIWTKIITNIDYRKYLIENEIDYVYVSYANEKFNEDFGDLFTFDKALNRRLYIVNRDLSNGEKLLQVVE